MRMLKVIRLLVSCKWAWFVLGERRSLLVTSRPERDMASADKYVRENVWVSKYCRHYPVFCTHLASLAGRTLSCETTLESLTQPSSLSHILQVVVVPGIIFVTILIIIVTSLIW